MIDLKRTLDLVTGGMTDPERTWQAYLPEAGDWKKTAFLLTGPLIIFSAVAAYVFSFLGSGIPVFGAFRLTIVSTIVSILISAAGAGAIAFIASTLAGVFGGKNVFSLGLAATSFAFIPGYLSSAVTWIPWLGILLGLGLFVYGLTLLWKIVPVYLAVPQEKRVGHYILTLILSVVAMFIVSTTIGRFLIPMTAGPGFGSATFGSNSDDSESGSSVGGGLYGGMVRQAELMEAAEEDRYDPPSNGRLSEDQVREFIRVMNRAQELQLDKESRLKELAEKAENEEEVSFSDLGTMMSGMTDIAGLQTSEIEVVKSAGGNWAEHQWVRETLRTAWIQKDINDAVEHNFELYQEYEEKLSTHIER